MKETLRSAFNRRQYMLARDFEVFYYSDRSFQNVSSHSHDYYEFYIFLEGAVEMEIDGNTYPLSRGDVVLVPPGILHRALQNGDSIYRRFIFWVSKAFATALLGQSPDYVWLMQKAQTQKQYIWHLDSADFNAVQAKILRLLEETKENRYGKSAAMSIAAEDLVLSINRSVYEGTMHKKVSEEKLFTRIMQYIDSHLEGDLSLGFLASRFYVSKYYISHLFTGNLGISLHQYIMKKRLQACRDAMLSGQPVTDAYLNYGFKDYSSFFRAFRKEYGLSPREYQKKHSLKS